jgi:hypothetical protein
MPAELKTQTRRRDTSRSGRPSGSVTTGEGGRRAAAKAATPAELSRLRNQLLRQEYDAWTALTGLLDPGGLDAKLVDGFHRELSRQMLKLCWLYARSGALEERYGGHHPFLHDLEDAGLQFEDRDFSDLDL